MRGIDEPNRTRQSQLILGASSFDTAEIASHGRCEISISHERREIENAVPGCDCLDANRLASSKCIGSECRHISGSTRECGELAACRRAPDADTGRFDGMARVAARPSTAMSKLDRRQRHAGR